MSGGFQPSVKVTVEEAPYPEGPAVAGCLQNYPKV
jgi:hypothetical protein